MKQCAKQLWRFSKKLIVLLVIGLLINGCGFKLRGMMNMPLWFNNVSIIVQNAHKELLPIFKEQLQSYGIVVVANPALADYLLIIQQDNTQQQITNVSASTTPRQYELIYTVVFSLISGKKQAKIKQHIKQPVVSGTVVVTRQFTVNNDRILGSNAEEALINTEMHRDAVMQVMNRLSQSSKQMS